MRTKNRAKVSARKLLRISCGSDGLLGEDRIRMVIKALPMQHDTLAILKEYSVLIERTLRRQTMLICSPAKLEAKTVESLRKYFERVLGQKFFPRVAVDNSLIAGIRVQAGDRIFEKSIAGTFEVLRTIA
ncbi:MAG: F0F1 ATP synthase subunit delta [Puniceicoccales bacterium]|jgi:F0F1-type ATP synthase delta subunit|nr:F0F1 ATP synthase subunit delta [Puniceicoccales bacterium]